MGRDVIRLVTSNPNKLREAQRILGVPLEGISLSLLEIQAATLESITSAKLRSARDQFDGRLLVEDVSLGLGALGGFPGPYVRWLMDSAGGEGLARLACATADPSAIATCCLGYWDGDQEQLFTAEVEGTIVDPARGTHGFGWDPWFQPNGSTLTFAEMQVDQKDHWSHRARAYRMLARTLSG